MAEYGSNLQLIRQEIPVDLSSEGGRPLADAGKLHRLAGIVGRFHEAEMYLLTARKSWAKI